MKAIQISYYANGVLLISIHDVLIKYIIGNTGKITSC